MQPEVLATVEGYVSTGEDLKIWEELGGTKADLRAREKALAKFVAKLKTEKEKAKRRKKKKVLDALFKKSDCLVYKMDNGNYGGAFVLTEEQGTEAGTNYIAITTIDHPEKPSLNDFRNADVFLRRSEEISFKGTELQKRWLDQPAIGGVYALDFQRKGFDIEVIGRLPMYRDYTVTRITGFGWRALQIIVPARDEYERINGKPRSRLKLARWTKKSWFKFFE